MLRRLSLAVALATAAIAGHAETAVTSKTDLVSLYSDAVKNSSDLAAAFADAQARKEGVPQARAGLLPQIGAGANYNDTSTDFDQSGRSTADRGSLVYQASLTQPLFRADRWFQLQAAEAVSEQAGLDYSNSAQNLILQTAEGYFAVLRAEDNLSASVAEEAAFKRQLDQARERFEVGLSDKTDVLEAQAGYDGARANRLNAANVVQDALQALTRLTGKFYETLVGMGHELPVQPPAPNDATQWVNTALKQNLGLLASNYGVDAAGESLRQQKSGHLPTLDAVASYSQGDNDGFGVSNSLAGNAMSQTTVGLELSIPIYTGGLTSSKVNEAVQRLDQSEQNRESLRRQVVQETRNRHRAVNNDIEQIQARRQTIISTQSAVEANEIGYQVGTRNIVDVLNAQRSLYTAVRDYNNARYDYILNNLRLKQSAGTLSPEDLQALQQWLKPDYDSSKDFLPADLAEAAKL
ncbi:TolC family outer membrane protein [Atopomonas sediminilitoris]|uniref:TolC family outer membrane protein n=1 Tax=Atopomonas sediminilitoris TaxID=2919919 RepID=UPI001F4DF520|nr:TolC family outer membrane protein [Atopomonas sediminilitoris]MCJ8168523.1 TolC family outer membrane protein [Atopomonas sediminilitoris]